VHSFVPNLYIGKKAKLNHLAIAINNQYLQEFKFGYAEDRLEILRLFLDRQDDFAIELEFTPDKPVFHNGIKLFSLKETGADENLWWFSQNQLIINP
jgi:hypothetical protein